MDQSKQKFPLRAFLFTANMVLKLVQRYDVNFKIALRTAFSFNAVSLLCYFSHICRYSIIQSTLPLSVCSHLPACRYQQDCNPPPACRCWPFCHNKCHYKNPIWLWLMASNKLKFSIGFAARALPFFALNMIWSRKQKAFGAPQPHLFYCVVCLPNPPPGGSATEDLCRCHTHNSRHPHQLWSTYIPFPYLFFFVLHWHRRQSMPMYSSRLSVYAELSISPVEQRGTLSGLQPQNEPWVFGSHHRIL